jgi:hypothetical protein
MLILDNDSSYTIDYNNAFGVLLNNANTNTKGNSSDIDSVKEYDTSIYHDANVDNDFNDSNKNSFNNDNYSNSNSYQGNHWSKQSNEEKPQKIKSIEKTHSNDAHTTIIPKSSELKFQKDFIQIKKNNGIGY